MCRSSNSFLGRSVHASVISYGAELSYRLGGREFDLESGLHVAGPGWKRTLGESLISQLPKNEGEVNNSGWAGWAREKPQESAVVLHPGGTTIDDGHKHS